MASIHPRRWPSGAVTWRVMFRVDGRQRQEAFTTRPAAESFRVLVERVGGAAAIEVRDARSAAGRDLAVPLLADWLEHHRAHATGISSGTRAEYARLAERTWLPMLGPLPLDGITRDHVRRWVNWQAHTITAGGTRAGVVLSAKSIANAHGLLSTVLASAVEAGHIAANPAHGVPLPAGQALEAVYLTPAAFAVLLGAVAPYWRPFVAFLAGTGARWGEATALRWGEVDLTSGAPSVRIVRAHKKGPAGVRVLGEPKFGSVRTVTLPVQLADLLATTGVGRGPDEEVFVGRQGATVAHQNFYPRVWRPALDTAALPGRRPRIHDLRHSHASWLIADAVPLPIIQARLGHRSITTTIDRYGHLDPTSGAVAAAAASRALAGALNPSA